MVFKKVQHLLDIQRIEDPEIPGYQVSLLSVVAWQLRELRLHGNSNRQLQLNLRLDGRPFFGKKCFLFVLSMIIYYYLCMVMCHNDT